MIIEQPARKSDTQDNCCTVFHPDFDVKLQKILHPQPMSGQGGYAFVSMQNQGQYRPKTSPFGSLLSGIPKNTLFLSYFC